MVSADTYSSAAAADGLVVAPVVLSEGGVVHAALTRGARTKRLQNDVDDPLGGLHIPSDDGSVVRRVQERALRNDNTNRDEAALVKGYVVADEASHAVDQGGDRDRFRRVAISPDLRTRSPGKTYAGRRRPERQLRALLLTRSRRRRCRSPRRSEFST